MVCISLQLADGIIPIDPDVLVDLEKRAKLIAENLNQVMGGLRNSLHAVSDGMCRLTMPYSTEYLYTPDMPPMLNACESSSSVLRVVCYVVDKVLLISIVIVFLHVLNASTC